MPIAYDVLYGQGIKNNEKGHNPFSKNLVLR